MANFVFTLTDCDLSFLKALSVHYHVDLSVCVSYFILDDRDWDHTDLNVMAVSPSEDFFNV